MSDIKYIIAGDVEEELAEQRRCARRRPFPCLAVVRYAIAGAVAVLSVTVISMVIRAMLRSEDIRLFVNNGYIGADILWITTQDEAPEPTKTTTRQIVGSSVSKADAAVEDEYPYPVSTNLGRHSGDAAAEYPDILTKSSGCYLGCSGSGSDGSGDPPPVHVRATKVTLQPATETNLRVILVVNNPGGRSKIDCSNTTVNITEAAPPHREIIAGLVLSNFTVPKQTMMTLQKRVKVTDPAVLRYIWDRYRGRPAFDVVVRVSSSVVSYPLGTKTEPKTMAYACRPVTLGLVQDEASFASQVDCTAEDDKERPTGAPAAAPMLAPAPEPVT